MTCLWLVYIIFTIFPDILMTCSWLLHYLSWLLLQLFATLPIHLNYITYTSFLDLLPSLTPFHLNYFTHVIKLWLLYLTLLLPGSPTNDYSRGGSLGPQSYFQLIWTPIGTCGTIIEQLIVRGVHQWSFKKKFLRVPKKLPEF